MTHEALNLWLLEAEKVLEQQYKWEQEFKGSRNYLGRISEVVSHQEETG